MNYALGYQTPPGTASIQGFRSTAGCDDTKRGWNSVEGNEIIANADYLRQVMVRFLSQQSDEDREMGKTFSKPLGGDFQNSSPVAAANYWKP